MISPGRRRLLVAGAALVVALLGPATTAVAVVDTDTSFFTFDSFHGDYTLGIDDGHATLRVVETLVARFPDYDQNRGIIRALPLKYGDFDLQVQVQSVTDEHGDAVYWERADVDGFAELALGTDDFVHGVQTYVIEYTMRDVIRHFSDSGGDEFYWDLNGDGWGQPFNRVSARIEISDELAASLTGRSACYVGNYGSTDGCVISPRGDGRVFEVDVESVSSFSTVTVAIGFEGGTVVQPATPRESWIVQIAPKALLGIEVLLLIIAIVIRSTRWGDRRGRGTIIAQYTPPEDSDLLLDANVVERRPSGLQALLVDFAVRGIVKVIDESPQSAAFEDGKRYSIELVDHEHASANELRVLVMLFGVSLQSGKRVKPGRLSADIGASLYGLPAFIAAKVIREGLRFEAGSVSTQRLIRRIGWVGVLLFVPIWFWASTMEVLDENVVVFAILAFVVCLFTVGTMSRPKRLTQKGAQLKEHLLGIREYLTIAEADRMRVLQSPGGALRVDVNDRDAVVKLNERLLGYAVLWGVEEHWAEVLRAQYTTSPAWLEGGQFDATFVRGFTTASTSSVRPIVTASSSSGSSWSSSSSSSFSSGSSGGGFSGGGGGGGGGGGR